MASVTIPELRKNFDEWHDRTSEGPVEVQRAGETTAVLVSIGMFRDLLASYRKAMPVTELSDEDMQLIRDAEVETSEPYELDDIPEIDEQDTPKSRRY